MTKKFITQNNDCIEAVKKMKDDSIDAIVTDPPYGLEFMGKDWDKGVPGIPFWKEFLRVTKPGAYLVAFGGSRTYHRMACAIEDAGWEIRDSLMWLYGCLSEDTEILTDSGWKSHNQITDSDYVAAWDSINDTIELSPISEIVIRPYIGKMIRFKNDNTDQLLTPNHRVFKKHCYRKQKDRVRKNGWEQQWCVDTAESINRWQSIKLPLASVHSGVGIGGNDIAALLGWVWTEGGFDASGNGVRIYQSSVNLSKIEIIRNILNKLDIKFSEYTRDRQYKERTYTEYCWYFSGEIASMVRNLLPLKHPSWSLLWRMTKDEKIAFYQAAMAGDGSGMDFYQKSFEDREWFSTLLHCIGKQGRINEKKYCVHVHNNSTTNLQSRHLKAYQEIDYNGIVWCVKVKTGAFIARRNGRIFITGNTGFPKSMDVSKAFDKAAGAERKVIGVKPGHENFINRKDHPLNDGWDRPWASDPEAVKRYHELTAPTTDMAKEWQGWGTALKPAFEPIILARKPFKGTVVKNIEAYGVGAINIDACRISTNGEVIHTPQSDPTKREGVVGTDLGITNADVDKFQQAQAASIEKANSMRRFPANVILSHHEDCLDGQCVENCPIRILDEQSGISKSSGGQASLGAFRDGDVYGKDRNETEQRDPGLGDIGGASRFFYCAKASRKERNLGCEEVLTWENVVLNQKMELLKQHLKDISDDMIRIVEDFEWNTTSFGNHITESSPQDFKFIIKTALSTITELKTWNSCQPLSTKDFTRGVLKTVQEIGSNLVKNAELINLLSRNITNEKMVSVLGAANAVLSLLLEIKENAKTGNIHSTVKPLSLMRWLCKLITPKNGFILDPFMGSGSTGCAAMLEGFKFIGIDENAEYVNIANNRIEYWSQQTDVTES